MPASSSDRATCSFELWWPIEVVPLQVEVVEPRRLTALEWALLRVMDEFRDGPPPLSEVAEELGLDDPGFLRDTLRDVVRLRALTPREGGTTDFSDLTFTELGERLYRRGQIEAEPSTHGVTFYVDALTDEDLPEPTGRRPWVQEGFLEGEVGEPRDTLGLERVRSGMRRFRPDILKGDAEVRAIHTSGESPLVGAPAVEWRPVTIHLHLSAEGALSASPEGLTKKAREFLANRDLEEDGVLPLHPVTREWGETTPPRCSSESAFSPWRRGVGELVPAAEVEAQARMMLGEAKTEIVLHACWGGAAGLEEDLRAAAQRGVRVLVVGAQDTGIFAWEGRTGIAVQVEVDDPVSGALVVDGTRGLLIDDVQLTCGGRAFVMELAGTLRDAPAAARREELVNASLASLPGLVAVIAAEPSIDRTPLDGVDAKVNGLLADDRVRVALARLAFAPVGTEAAVIVRLAASLAPGIERVPLMRSLRAAARAHAPALSPTVFEQACVTAWEGVVAACRRSPAFPDGLVERLATWAPESITGEAYVDFAVAAWAKRAQSIEEGVARLVAIGAAADSRWRTGVARSCRSWCEARDEVLAPEEWSEEKIKRRAVLVSRLMSPSDAREWADACLTKLPRPASLAGMQMWGGRAEGLRELAGSRVEERAADIVSALLDGRENDAGTTLRFVGSLLPAKRLATILLGETPTTQSIARVRAAFINGGAKGITDEDWTPLVERSLPDWLGTFNAPEHGDDVARFAADLAFPAGKKALAKWARRLTSEIQRPARIEGVVWWLGEVAALAPALGEEVVSVGMAMLRDHLGSLRDARKRGAPAWREIRDAWLGLGYGEGALNDVASDPTPGVTAGTSSKNPNKKDKKRR